NPAKLGTRPSISDWSCSDSNSHSGCPSNPNLKSLDNKKPRHPAGVFHIGSLGITPVVPCSPCAYLLLFFSGASCSLCPHHRKVPISWIAAKGRNSRKPRRTK